MPNVLMPFLLVLLQAAVTTPCVCCPEDVPRPVVQLSTHGRIEAMVSYEGAPLPGVAVRIATEHGTLVGVTNEAGRIELANVAPGGPYVAIAELEGLKKRKVRKIVVRAGETTTLNVRMRLDSDATCIDCGSAEPNRLDGPGFVITREMIDHLPI